MSTDTWGPLTLGADDEVEKSLGDLRLRLRRHAEEIWMRVSHDGPEEWRRIRTQGDGPGDDPERAVPSTGQGDRRPRIEVADEEWIRWAIRPEDGLELRPVMPDRPVVVSSEQPFFLPPEGRAQIFVRIPLFVGIQIPDGRGGGSKLEEVPSQVLSDTWWGTFTEGEIGYWVETRARREIDPSSYEPHLAICPFLLSNASDQALPVERFAVRVAYLTLFGRDRARWTDEVQVRYKGGVEGSEIRYTGRVPEMAGDVELMAPSREKAPRGLHARTFGMLRSRVGTL